MLLASNESPYPPLPAVREAIERALARLNRYPDPTYAPLRDALSRPLRSAGRADRGRQRLVRHPARRRRGAARARRRDRLRVALVLACTRSCAAASGAHAIKVPLDAEDRHDLPAMLREITVATRLAIVCNPQQPDQHRARARGEIARVPRRRCPPTSA